MEENPADIHQVIRKSEEDGGVDGFPPLVMADFYAGDFGWEVNRWLHLGDVAVTTRFWLGVYPKKH